MKEIRFLHMADLHIGSSAYIKLNLDAMSILHDIVDDANKNACDFIFICGDLFDAKPQIDVQKRISSILANFNGKIFIIYGNHDFDTANDIIWPENTYVMGLNGMENIYIEDYNLRIWGYSYSDYQIKESIYNTYFNENETNKDEINILLAHGGDKLHIPIDYNDLSQKFNYVALGHIHTHQCLNKNVVYSGSLIPQNKKEQNSHGYILGTIGETLSYSLIEIAEKYISIDFDISSYTDIEKLYMDIKNIIDKKHLYIISLKGTHNIELKLDIEHLYNIGNIETIYDNTTADIDYDEIEKLNKNNILGIFIERMKVNEHPLAKTALEYGVKAFLEAKSNDN